MKCNYGPDFWDSCDNIANFMICANNRGDIEKALEVSLGYEVTFICSECLSDKEPEWRKAVLIGDILNFVIIDLT